LIIFMWPLIKPIKYKTLIRIDVDLFCASLMTGILFHQTSYTNKLA
jgi:hypothetical protein